MRPLDAAHNANILARMSFAVYLPQDHLRRLPDFLNAQLLENKKAASSA